MAIKGNNRTRSLVWDDEAPAESRFRRVQQSVPLAGRGLPGMPLEMPDPDGDGPEDFGRLRFSGSRGRWWRPASTLGRVLAGLGALMILVAIFAAVHYTRTYLQRDARFRIAGTGNIQASGLSEVTRAQILPVFGEDIGRNVFFVPLADRRKELEQIPWVQQATVMRFLPDQIRVSVVERTPVAFVRHGQQIGLVDANGVLLNMPVAMMAQHHYSFPVLTGIDSGDSLASRKARMSLYLRLMKSLDASNHHFSEQLSEIDLTDPEDARVVMPQQGTDILAHFGEDQFLERYQRYEAHIAEWRQQYPNLAAVDLRYDRQVVLEMASGKAAKTATDSGDGTPEAKSTEKASPSVRPAAIKDSVSPKSAKIKSTADARPVAKSKAAKARAEKIRAEKVREKRRAEARRIALNLRWQKTAAKPHPAAVGGQGQ